MKYFIKQKVFSFKDKFNITDEQQNTLFQVEGKFFSIRNKLELTNPSGDVLFRAQKKLFKFFPTYMIFDGSGKELATVKRKFAIRPNFSVTALNQDLDVDGNFFAHSFTIRRGNQEVVNISKKVFSFGDSYVIDIHESQDQVLYLFITVIIDQILEEAEEKRRNARD